MVPMPQQIVRRDWRVDWKFILPSSIAVREKRGAVWRSKRIGVCAVLPGRSISRAFQFEVSLRLVRPGDTIRLPAAARNRLVPAFRDGSGGMSDLSSNAFSSH
jgi:hypothetical protein